MKIYLLDININVVNAWNEVFSDFDDVEIVYSDFEQFMQTHEVDCVVSPGNSHGVMAGGYDRALSEYFGWDLTKRVQAYIIQNFKGQQPVGSSFIISTGKAGINLIHTPSMINPSRIQDPEVVYQCSKSTLKVAKQNNVSAIVLPAFGGACGGLAPDVIAEKMHRAICEENNSQ